MMEFVNKYEDLSITGGKDDITVQFPEAKYKIIITEGFWFENTNEPPSWFHRKMMSLFLGWKFEIYSSQKT